MSVYGDETAIWNAILGFRVQRALATLPATTATQYFTVTGLCAITGLIGLVTTVVQTQANDAKWTATPTAGSAVDMCAALDITADEAGCLYGITGTPANAMVGTNAGLTTNMITKIVVNSGTLDFDCAATNTGATSWTLFYVPLAIGSAIVAA